MIHFQPLEGREAKDAQRVLANEFYAVGLNVLLARSVSLWPHAPNTTDSFEKHLLMSVKMVKDCAIVLLFGTAVTKAVLDEGIAGIIGLERTSQLLPGCILIPALSPEDVPGKTLGEFRWVMQKLANKVSRL